MVYRQFCVSKLHPAETFPLILSFGIVIQGLIFAAAQGQGMQRLYEDGCDIIAQYMLPGKSRTCLLETNTRLT